LNDAGHDGAPAKAARRATGRTPLRGCSLGKRPRFEHDIAENAKRTRGLFETFMQEHGVPFGAYTAALSSKWLEDAPEGDDFVGSHGRLFDVIW
jgi:hypothetical protein